MHDKLGRWPFAVGIVLAAAVLAVATRGGVQTQAASMLAALTHIGLATLLAVVALGSTAAILSGVEWWRMLHRLGHPLPFRAALAAYLSAGLGGYVLNSVGPALGSAASLRKHGVSPGRAALLTLMANALGFCGILVWTPLGLPVLARTGVDHSLPVIGGQGPLAVSLVLLGLAAVMLFVLRALTSASASRSRLARALLGSVPGRDCDGPRLSARHLLAIVPWSAASWVMGVGALYVALSSMSPGVAVGLGTVIGSAALASGLGSLAFFVPEGIGVSESAVAVLLSHATGVPVTTSLAAALTVRALDPLTKLSLLGILAIGGGRVLAGGFAGLNRRFSGPEARAFLAMSQVRGLDLALQCRRASARSRVAVAAVRSAAPLRPAAWSAGVYRLAGDALRWLRTSGGSMKARSARIAALGTLLLGMTVLLPHTAQAHAQHTRCHSGRGDTTTVVVCTRGAGADTDRQ